MSAADSHDRGLYEKKQLDSASRLIRFSHQSRFRLARRLVAPFAGKKLIDYGCGDGTFLLKVVDLFPRATGADIDGPQLADCKERLGERGLEFKHVDDLRRSGDKFDVVVCMETLEHCAEAAVKEVLVDLARLTDRGGTIVISVPIEIGPSLIAKQVWRRISGWRKVGDYAYCESYSTAELLKMLFADEHTVIERPAYSEAFMLHGVRHSHKGFNWKALRHEVERYLCVERVLFSPFNWSRGLCSSQAWLVCAPRSAGGSA